MARNSSRRGGELQYRVMTVALVREPKEADAVEVAFSESARFYRLLRSNPEFKRILQDLHAAKNRKQAVRVLIESSKEDVIEDTQPISQV